MADCTDTEAPKHVPKVDIACAFNYSVCLFKTRADLLQYLKVARSSLVPDGMFFADLYGGTDAYIPSTFKKHFPDFTYVWETSRFDPITHEAAMAIHFRFPDKSRIKNAFTYGWRLWSIPELVDALHDAGFSSVKIWWAEVDRTGEESYEYLETTHAEQCAMWNCYVVAAP